MTKSLRILLVEDSPDDAELVARELRRGGSRIELSRVEDGAALRDALTKESWDAVISDWSLPTFNAPAALEVVKELGLELPFLIVSGTIGEELAVQALRDGAHDFLLKGKLARLNPALERALADHAMRLARRAAEADLLRSEQRYRALFEKSPLPMLVHDAESLELLTANAAALRAYGYEHEQLTRLSIRDLRPAEDLVAELPDPPIPTDESTTRRHQRRDGTIFHVELRAHEIEYDGRRARLVSAVDLTDRQRLEQQLRQSQKMDAIGRLAGGIAHDFNNLLSVILSFADLILADLSSDTPIYEDISQIRLAGKRAAELTRQLLTFSRQQVVEPRVIDLNEVVSNMERMLHRVLGADIKLVWSPEVPLGAVRIDPGYVEQVIMNLVVNARDAMPDGGRLTLKTANVVLGADDVRSLHGLREGPHVLFSVADTGCGMSAQTISNIFEPFFTTKEKGKGTGLGLSTVFGIVKQSGGSIGVESALGRGTTFFVYLPRTAPPAER